MNMNTVHSDLGLDTVQIPVRKYTLTDLRLFEHLPEFCRCHKIAQLPAEIRKVMNKIPGIDLKHLHLSLYKNNGSGYSVFTNMSLFEPGDDVRVPDITLYPGGIEIHCPFSDLDDQTGAVRLGFGPLGIDNEDRMRILELLVDAFRNEARHLLVPLAMKRHSFLSNFVHQIRNPLATIITAASQIEMKEEPDYNDDDRILLGFINSEAQRIENLLAKYSQFSYADSLAKTEFDLTELIRQIGRETSMVDFKNIKIEHDIEDSIRSLKISADRTRLNEALVQLLENCLESFRDNSGKVRISLSRDDETAKISILDNGPGIRPELLRKVKEPFFSTKDGGSGLGLAIACKTVSAHGGRLTVDSVEGAKTEVCIELPCKQGLL